MNSDNNSNQSSISTFSDKLSYLEQPIKENDKNVCDDKTVQLLSHKFNAEQNCPAIKQYAEELQNPKPQPGKEILNNGPSAVPKFEAIDVLTLGITYLLKLLFQGQRDCAEFKQKEGQINANCKNRGIDYVMDNDKDKIKDVMQGIGLYHDVNDLKKQLANDNDNETLKNQLAEKEKQLNKACAENRTLNALVNSQGESCAMANGLFHKAVFASRVNQNGEKEFFLIDQGGRKVPGSGFPNDDDMAKSGINIMQVASTNGMCVATASAGLQEISVNGLDNYLDRYAGLVRSTEREKVHALSQQHNVMKEKGHTMQIGGVGCTNSNTKLSANISMQKQKNMAISIT